MKVNWLVLVIFLFKNIGCLSNKNITDFLQIRIEKYANQLVSEMESYWGNVCNYDSCSCTYQSCAYPLPTYCHERWSIQDCENCGSQINLNFSDIIIGNQFYNVDPEDDSLKEILCASQKLDNSFYEITMKEEMLVWIYFGSFNGILRMYPANPGCITYDDRYRPWYVAATTGLKNIMLIIDTSTNMSEEKLKTMKEVVTNLILPTLTFNDYAGIVTIGNENKQFSPYLLRADTAGTTFMTNFINSLKINGTSNYEKSFKKAFDIIDRSEDSDRSSHCQQVIVFISGGSVQEGITKHDELIKFVDDNDYNSFIFTYSIGEDEDPFLKKLACHRNGIYENINVPNYYPSMLSYFQALGSFINSSKITYAEPYSDANGAGFMTTGSIPVYDRSLDPPFLIGVIGFDILMQDLLKIGRIDEVYVAFQEIGSASCSKANLTPCQVESMRPDKYKCGSEFMKEETTCSPYLQTLRKCPEKQRIHKALCNYEFTTNIPACCTQNVCNIVYKYALAVIFGFSLVVILILGIFYFCFQHIWNYFCCDKFKIKEQDPNEDQSVRNDADNVEIKSKTVRGDASSADILSKIQNENNDLVFKRRLSDPE